MPPKEKGKKGGKQLVALAQLNAVQTTYKAASRNHGVSVNKTLATQIEDAIQEGTVIDKISFTGPDVGPGTVKAALEVMAGYPTVKNFVCAGCNIGSEGLEALAALVRASGDKWWKGSKLRLLEVVSDGVGKPLESWPATCLAHMSGGLAVQGQGHEQPSLILDSTIPAITQDTLCLQQTGLPRPSVIQLDEEWGRAASVSAPITSTMYHALEQARAEQQTQEEMMTAAGVMLVPPAAGYQTWGKAKSPADGVHGSLTSTSSTIDDMAARLARLSSLARGEAVMEPQNSGGLPQSSPSPCLDSVNEEPTPFHQTPGGPMITAGPGNGSLKAPPEMLNVATNSSEMFKTRPLYGKAAAGSNFTVGRDSGLHALRPLTFSPDSLEKFSLALGAVGHGLQILVLDHNQLGDMGMHKLATGLKRCSTLTHLSVSDCGLGPVAAMALASTMIKDPNPLTAAAQPKLMLLNISRNPLGGRGLDALCDAFAECTTLQVLNMNNCDLTDEDVAALSTLARALTANQSITHIDLDCNFFGDPGAVAFFPLLSTTKHIRKFRITARGMTRAGGGQLTALVRENLPKKGKKKIASANKKK